MTTPAPSHTLLQHIIEHARGAILLISADDMIIVDVNIQACLLAGYQKDNLLGQPLSLLESSLLDLFFWEDIKNQSNFSGTRTIESEWLTSIGTIVPIEKTVSRFTELERSYWIIYAEDLSRRQEIIEQQTRLASQLQSSLDATAEGIMSTDLSGNIHNLNQKFVTLWQLPEEINSNRNLNETITYIRSCLTEDHAFAHSLMQTVVNPEIDTEDLLTLQNGKHFICISKPEYLHDNVIGRVFSVRDVTELIAARDLAESASKEKSQMLDALRITESRLRRLLNSSLIGIFQGDLRGNVFEANKVLLKLIGVEYQELTQHSLNWFNIINPIHPQTHRQIVDELQHNEQIAPFEAELISKQADDLYVVVGLAMLEGSKHELVGFVMDISEQRRVDKIKSEFISVVSHELRTPLTAIRGALSLLEGGVLGAIPASAMQMISVANRNSTRLISLVNDILDMEKLISGKMRINIERTDLLVLAKQALEVNAAYASSLNVSYRLNSDCEHAWVMTDTDRTMQVFANLMSNAAKFSPVGDYVEIKITHQQKLFRIEVIDHGAGIPESFRNQIFSKFAQADSGNTRRQGGTGLGLSITKTLVEKMGGEIGFDTEEGAGTTFWFTLQAAPS